MKRAYGGQSGLRWMRTALGLPLLLAAGLAAAQVYKWKDEHGTVHYSDTPPPRGQAQLIKTDAQGPAQAPALPYELARAVQAAPVLLYTTTRCDGCDQGRALLRARGIPFSERTVTTGEDQQQLERAGGGKSELPLLLVGSRKVAGFQAAAWNEALSSAAYPKQKMLPAGYQFAPPSPAAGNAATASPAAAPVRGQIRMPPDEAAAQAAEQQPRSKPPAGATPPTQ